MGNCLVTKLKERVNNDNLFRKGEIKISVTPQGGEATRYLGIYAPTMDVTVDGGTWENNAVSNTNCVVHMQSKYDIQILESYNQSGIVLLNSVEEIIKYSSNLRSLLINANQEYVDLRCFDGAPCKTILRGFHVNTPLSGDIANFSGCSALPTIFGNSPLLYGDIINLANCTSLNEAWLGYSKCTGSINDLAAAMVAAGRSSGTLTIGTNNIITKDGTEIATTNAVITFDSSLSGGYSVSYID